MASFDKLTDGEFRRLVALARQTERAKAVSDDDIYWGHVPVGDGSYVWAIDERGINAELDARSQLPLEHIQAMNLHVKRWAECGYVSVISSERNDFARFLLTPRGEEFLAYSRKSKRKRWFIDLWSDLRTELVSGIVAVVVSVIVNLIMLAFK